jgi:hypothetical protein
MMRKERHLIGIPGLGMFCVIDATIPDLGVVRCEPLTDRNGRRGVSSPVKEETRKMLGFLDLPCLL